MHDKNGLQQAIETTEKLFKNQNAAAESLSEEDLENLNGVEYRSYDMVDINNGIDVVSFLTISQIFPSKGEAKKMIQNGGISINRKKISSLDFIIYSELLLHKKYLLVQKGKKNYYLVKVM